MNGQSSSPCSFDCLIVPGYYNCTFSPLKCVTECGDGIKAGLEQCDEGK